MTTTLTARDETLAGGPVREFQLDVLTEELTVRELIRAWVHQTAKDTYAQRVRERDERLDATARGLGDLRAVRPVDEERALTEALRAFEGNQVLVLVGDRQVETLDERVTVGPKDAVTFLKLTPLVGG